MDACAFEEYMGKVAAFHGNTSPGAVLGGIMVTEAQRNLPEGGLYDAISETANCLPDAIQLLTPCTTGNGWMRIVNTGRFSMCLYDKHTGEGLRVFIDPEKIKSYQEINNWFYVLKPKKEQDKDLLLEEIKNHGADILGFQKVNVNLDAFHHDEKSFNTCKICNEPCLTDKDGVCAACSGKIYMP